MMFKNKIPGKLTPEMLEKRYSRLKQQQEYLGKSVDELWIIKSKWNQIWEKMNHEMLGKQDSDLNSRRVFMQGYRYTSKWNETKFERRWTTKC